MHSTYGTRASIIYPHFETLNVRRDNGSRSWRRAACRKGRYNRQGAADKKQDWEYARGKVPVDRESLPFAFEAVFCILKAILDEEPPC